VCHSSSTREKKVNYRSPFKLWQECTSYLNYKRSVLESSRPHTAVSAMVSQLHICIIANSNKKMNAVFYPAKQSSRHNGVHGWRDSRVCIVQWLENKCSVHGWRGSRVCIVQWLENKCSYQNICWNEDGCYWRSPFLTWYLVSWAICNYYHLKYITIYLQGTTWSMTGTWRFSMVS
jgi:hypothetical protein